MACESNTMGCATSSTDWIGQEYWQQSVEWERQKKEAMDVYLDDARTDGERAEARQRYRKMTYTIQKGMATWKRDVNVSPATSSDAVMGTLVPGTPLRP